MADNLITALEIIPTHIKLAQSQKKASGKVITKLFVRDIPVNTPENVARALNELLAASKIKATEITLALPRQFLTLRLMKFPSLDEKEIEKMAQLQVAKQIPFPIEDITWGFSVAEKDTAGYSQVLIAICQKEVIRRYLNFLAKGPLKVSRVTLSSEGICRWYQYFSQKNNLKDAAPVVLLDIDKENTDICFCHKGNLIFTRSVAFALADLKGAKPDTLAEELRKTFSILQRDQAIQEIGKIVAVTAAAQTNDLVEKLKAEFSCPVEVANPLAEIPLEKEATLPLALRQASCSATAVLGLALGWLTAEINLLPEEVKKEQDLKSRKQDLVSLGALLLAFLVFSLAAMGIKIYKKEQYLKKLDVQLKAESPKSKKIENSLKQLSLVKERLSQRNTAIDVIYQVYSLIPEGMSLSILSYDENEAVTLQGVSNKSAEVSNFLSALEKSPYFKNAELKYASKRKLRQGEVTDFRITCVAEKVQIKKP